MKHQFDKLKVSRETLKDARELYNKNETRLEKYIDNLLEWNYKINLVSRSVSRETLCEHVVHSLLPMQLGLIDAYDSWVDSGSGGGLPGIPLAITNPDKTFYLNDNVKKKMRAVDDIIQKAEVGNAETVAKSISLVDLKKGTGIVTKHAFKVDDLLRLLGSKPWKTIIMWKGVEGAVNEVTRSGKNLKFTLYEFDFGNEEEFYDGKGLLKIER
ncbi:16S rRNA (guanine(527)-N(7))-methyltransferase RsmG [Rhodohalobacter sp. 8-1]|uniref:16S rRNA (guanine(527)-N(7))-methyltransferase RsmG n=1 Tax=Rhodohalobacter sp. 8-1 TaxID=3131972 RepID=UPI0030EE0502